MDLACGHGQDLHKFSRTFRKALIEKYVGVDFATTAIDEATQRYEALRMKSSQEFDGFFFVGDVRKAEVFERLANQGHNGFNVLSIQFALHYLAESEHAMEALLSNMYSLIEPGGIVIGTVPSCDAICELFSRAACLSEKETSTSADRGACYGSGNELFRLHFTGEAWSSLYGGQAEAVDELIASRWGASYTFWLGRAVDGQEEYVVPWDSFEQLATRVGFRVVVDAPFPDILTQYGEVSPFYQRLFTGETLSADEEELSNFYTAFVLQRPLS